MWIGNQATFHEPLAKLRKGIAALAVVDADGAPNPEAA